MTRAVRSGTDATNLRCAAPHYEAAVRVREFLNADFAAVATVEANTLVIRALVGECAENLVATLSHKLGGWGPIVVDDARLISAPAMRDNRVVAILVGYSAAAGHFTGKDLERLMSYGESVAAALDDEASTQAALREALLSPDDLFHVSRLVTMGEFSACFAHEVFNPLMMIRGHLRFIEEMLSQGDPLRSNVEVIDRASRRIEDIAKRMLDFSRKRSIEMTQCDVQEIIQDAVRFVQPYLRSQLIVLQVRAPERPVQISADRSQMVQALVNLMQNAADAMADSAQRILDVSAKIAGDRLLIFLSDTGKGIATADVGRVFNPFFTTKGENGTGLGLYITRRVVEEHRGTITLSTNKGGTTFTIALPLQ